MMAAFLERGCQLPTAVIAINDFTAGGVTHVFLERGIRIPEDISVVSFDNTFMTETCVPQLTSVAYDYHAMGELLIETAVQAIHSPAMHGPAIQGSSIHSPADGAGTSGDAASRAEILPGVRMIRSALVVRNSSGQDCSD